MSDSRSIWLASGGLLAAAGAVIGGILWRDRVDLGSNPLTASSRFAMDGLRADRSDSVTVSETAYFTQMADLLKREYVEPIADEQKLASGAVRGMLNSLSDPNSMYMDPEEFRAFRNARVGRYEGIGVDLVVEMVSIGAPKPTDASAQDVPKSTNPMNAPPEAAGSTARAPKVLVAAVAAGSPAEKAGIKVGDWLEMVDSLYVVNPNLMRAVRSFQEDVRTKKLEGSALMKAQNELRKKLEKSILPLRARDKVVLGESGKLSITWIRDGKPVVTSVERAKTEVPGFVATGSQIRTALVPDAVDKLRSAVQGKSEITLDLRNNVWGDFESMRRMLAVLAPSGDYGALSVERSNQKAKRLSIEQGNSKPPKITLLVDRSTRGPAEILALALSSKGLAKLSGTSMAGAPIQYQEVALPDGGGFTLVTGVFKPAAAAAKPGKAGDRS
jgi:carboxyl-terminal processing protease